MLRQIDMDIDTKVINQAKNSKAQPLDINSVYGNLLEDFQDK